MLRTWNLLASLTILSTLFASPIVRAQSVEDGATSSLEKSLKEATKLIKKIDSELTDQKNSIKEMSAAMKTAFEGVGNDIELLQQKLKNMRTEMQGEMESLKDNDLKQDLKLNKLQARLQDLEKQIANMQTGQTQTSKRVATAARTGRIQFSNYFPENLTLVVDGQIYSGIATGTTYTVENLAAGVHTYEIRWPRTGWSVQKTVNVNAAETFSITAAP